MKNLTELLEEYEKRGDSMDAFERDNMDALLMQRGVRPPSRTGAVKISSAKIHPNQPKGGDKAQFDIRIKRNSANIANTNLECAVFGSTHLDGGYQGIVNPASGGSFVVTGAIYNTLPDRVRFAHTVGANTDQIDVFCNQINYPTFVKSTQSDLFRISNIRYTLTDPTQLGQFATPFEVRTKSLFGKASANPVSVASFKKPEQFQNGIIDLPIEAVIDKETILMVSMFPAVCEVTLSIFVERFHKRDAMDLKRLKGSHYDDLDEYEM